MIIKSYILRIQNMGFNYENENVFLYSSSLSEEEEDAELSQPIHLPFASSKFFKLFLTTLMLLPARITKSECDLKSSSLQKVQSSGCSN